MSTNFSALSLRPQARLDLLDEIMDLLVLELVEPAMALLTMRQRLSKQSVKKSRISCCHHQPEFAVNSYVSDPIQEYLQ
jgi:hypothetical protein